ncbi:FMRFamide receptor-like [Elysia marginata]|uniref:FMRFamide receptor-like n=1 Tax=Elysia marginata TaxID=1093978 RepID=A0AAV4JSG5_9GAST|nr:FMRFamide receptor-like [Elysia marginata]
MSIYGTRTRRDTSKVVQQSGHRFLPLDNDIDLEKTTPSQISGAHTRQPFSHRPGTPNTSSALSIKAFLTLGSENGVASFTDINKESQSTNISNDAEKSSEASRTNDSSTSQYEVIPSPGTNTTTNSSKPREGRSQYSNRTDNCGYTFSDKTCPPPTPEEMRQIDAVCYALEVQIDTIASVALIFGLPGSVFALITVCNMAVNPTTLYMGCLAVSDFISLIFGIQVYRFPDDGSLTYTEIAAIWFGRIFQTFSHWTLALICLERFVSVRFPTQKRNLYSLRNTGLSVGVIFIVSVTPFIANCAYYMNHDYEEDLNLALTIIQNLFYITAPGALIVVLSSLTAIQLKRAAKRRETMTSSSSVSDRSSRMEADLTRIMLLTSVCFVVFTLPWGAINTFDRVRNLFCPWTEAVYSFFFYGFVSITFLNHAVNFFVYYACARGFRNQFWLVICRKSKVNMDTKAS